MSNFTLTSPEFKDQAPLQLVHEFDGYDGTGQNRSPTLQWQGVPEGTKSFALTLYDPDAPTGSGFWHWILFDIDSSVTQLTAGLGSADGTDLGASGTQAANDYGAIGYGGPCPPKGMPVHHYIFTVHALGVPSWGAGQRDQRCGAFLHLPEHAGHGYPDRPLQTLRVCLAATVLTAREPQGRRQKAACVCFGEEVTQVLRSEQERVEPGLFGRCPPPRATSTWRSTIRLPRQRRLPSRYLSPARHSGAPRTAWAGRSAGRRIRVRAQAAHLFRRAVLLRRNVRAHPGLRDEAQG